MSKLQSALALAQRFRVFPLVPNGKIPAITGDWQEVATRDPAKIERLWTDPVFGTEQDYNIGIALDRDTLVVDVDTRDGKRGGENLRLWEACNEQLPETYTVTTASGGEHRYFNVDDSSGFPKELCKHVDLKGYGGYVVAPGSTISGAPYNVGSAHPAVGAPALHMARQPHVHDRTRSANTVAVVSDLDTPDAIKRATAYLTTAPDNGTFKVACRVKDFGIGQETCLDLMAEHWSGANSRDEAHISFRVENAYRYGQSPPGIASPEAEFDAVEVAIPTAGAPARRGKLFLEWWRDSIPDFDQPYLVDDVYDLNTMVVTYGESNSGKSYVVLDQAFAIATGRDWNGHKTHKGLVVYVAAEGGRGFRKRIAAFRQRYGVNDVPFALIPCPVDLFATGADTRTLVDLIHDAERQAGLECVMVVVDTLARAMGGGDENSGADMGVLLKNCDRVRESTGATFHLIHHSGKDKAKGARGWSGLRGHIDTEIEVAPGRMEVTKQRDMEKGKAFGFALAGAEIGKRTDGRAVTACTVDWLTESEFEVRVSPDAQKLFGLLEQLLDARRDEIEADGSLPQPDKADMVRKARIPWATWQMSALSCLKGARGKPLARSSLFPLRLELSNSGMVQKDARNQWFM